MDYYLLTDLAARVGYHLALSGAETFRVEETIRRIIGAYGIECEAFSIPNCVMVSLEAANGKPLMVMKRVGFHGNDLESVEKLNALSRRICAETPDPSVAAQWLDETLKGRRHYSVPVYYLGNFCAAAGFWPSRRRRSTALAQTAWTRPPCCTFSRPRAARRTTRSSCTFRMQAGLRATARMYRTRPTSWPSASGPAH